MIALEFGRHRLEDVPHPACLAVGFVDAVPLLVRVEIEAVVLVGPFTEQNVLSSQVLQRVADAGLVGADVAFVEEYAALREEVFPIPGSAVEEPGERGALHFGCLLEHVHSQQFEESRRQVDEPDELIGDPLPGAPVAREHEHHRDPQRRVVDLTVVAEPPVRRQALAMIRGHDEQRVRRRGRDDFVQASQLLIRVQDLGVVAADFLVDVLPVELHGPALEKLFPQSLLDPVAGERFHLLRPVLQGAMRVVHVDPQEEPPVIGCA
jgi:hypothetical protein